MPSLALVLHAHLPFVRHPEHDDFLEEDWLFEAITESYIPLIAMMERLVNDSVPFKITLSVTPTLSAMLNDALLRERYLRHLERSIDLAAREIERNRHHDELRALARFYLDLFSKCRRRFVEDWHCDLLGALRALRDAGALEIISSAATHAILPLLESSPQALRAQILIGRDSHREIFGADPNGFWLPECAYAPALDPVLQKANLRWFVLDAHGLMFANPKPQRAIYAPCYTPAGPAAFARDRDSSRQVWSAQEGYPGDPAYRDFYRDIGFDLPLAYLFPARVDAQKKFTGIKYHRITGAKIDKKIYDRATAERVADAHANHFYESRRVQLNELNAFGFDPIIVAPFDAELFGHWWFEGPRFLESFIRRAAQDRHKDYSLTTPSEFLASHPTQQIVEPAASSWGEKGYLGVWLDGSNAWIYPHLHAAARRMTEMARMHSENPLPFTERVLKQLARELLLAQSSDWAFLIKTGTARDYATKSAKDHLLRFNRLHDQLSAGAIDENFLSDCEWRDNLFPNVNWRYYI